MSIVIKVEQIKELMLKRVPPGDRCSPVDNPSVVLESLTEGVEYFFQKKGKTEFFLSARRGTVEVIHEKEVEVEKPITKYSLYGEN